MVRGFAEGVKRTCHRDLAVCTGNDTLLLRDLWFAHVSHKWRMGCPAPGVVQTHFNKTPVAVYGVPDLVSIAILLPIVFPPAN